MTIEATVIRDSVSPDDIRITSVQLRYPRFIHAELMTHRVFSRNASSSRAIPVEKMIEDLRRDPAMPVHWGTNKPGMQAGEELTGLNLSDAKQYWIDAMYMAISEAQKLIELGLHKQIANRILEPWAHINVLVTSTSWANFFALRRHPDAQPEIKELADRIYEAMGTSTPNELQPGEWHLPYITQDDRENIEWSIMPFEDQSGAAIDIALKVSVARCARVSYLTHDQKPTTIEADLALYDRLVGSEPLHASPAEHIASPDVYADGAWTNPHLQANYKGWIQYRKTLPYEFVPD